MTSGLCRIIRPWAPSALLTPSPILFHDLGGIFNIDICAIWHKIAQIQREFITSFAVLDLS